MEPLLELRGVSKSFDAVHALRDVSIALRPGEIHALAGENGAGKSTVVRIIGGEHQPDSGTLLLDGAPLDPDRPSRGLSIADQQVIEIAKALSGQARVIVMDEPTAALSNVEDERLFQLARRLADGGAALLFVSHRLEEMYALCHRVTVLRDGELVTSAPMAEIDRDTLVRRMVGRSVEQLFPDRSTARGDDVLVVSGVSRAGVFSDVSLTVRRGEIVGLAGLVGSGRSEAARAIFGVDRRDSGTVTVNGRPLCPRVTRARRSRPGWPWSRRTAGSKA